MPLTCFPEPVRGFSLVNEESKLSSGLLELWKLNVSSNKKFSFGWFFFYKFYFY